MTIEKNQQPRKQPDNPEQPEIPKKKSIFESASPNQRRLFEKMGLRLKVSKPDIEEGDNKSNSSK